MPRSTSESTTSTCPADLEIFSPPRSRNSLCIHVPTHGCTSSTHSLWATSLVWWMRTWSIPPVWMSKRLPRYLVAMAEHSMCQPGKPRPQGESHSCCRSTPGGVSFQSAKSAGWRLASMCSTRPDVASSSRSRWANSA